MSFTAIQKFLTSFKDVKECKFQCLLLRWQPDAGDDCCKFISPDLL